jgi:hypothetical protein
MLVPAGRETANREMARVSARPEMCAAGWPDGCL